MRIIRDVLIVVLFIGVIAVGINAIFGMNAISYLRTEQVGKITYYIYDFPKYFENLTTNITAYYDLSLQTPNYDFSDWNFGFISVVNFLIMMINILLYPIRVGAYVIRIVLALIGINLTNPDANMTWLVEFINNGVSLTMDYIPYI